MTDLAEIFAEAIRVYAPETIISMNGGPFDEWLAIPVAEIVLAMTGAVGMWFAFSRKKPLAYLGFALVQLPLPLFIEAMRF